jgi:hypothetical protein
VQQLQQLQFFILLLHPTVLLLSSTVKTVVPEVVALVPCHILCLIQSPDPEVLLVDLEYHIGQCLFVDPKVAVVHVALEEFDVAKGSVDLDVVALLFVVVASSL